MASKIRWSLPEGVDELLPPKALQVEKLRRRLIDLYVSSGYQFIIPPLLELSETLGGEAHEELQEYAFTFKDELTGKNLSIRPDISEQASRIDAYRLDSNDTVKLCYVGDVVKRKVSKILRSRATIQAGAEIFGDSSIDADVESINLMIESLQSLGLEGLTLSLGHAGLVSIILERFKGFGESKLRDLESALSRKSVSDINSLLSEGKDQSNRNLLISLCKLYGGEEVIDKARTDLKALGSEAIECLDYLKELIKNLDLDKKVKLHLDLGEIQGFRYHNGVVFSAYIESAGYSLSKGGRYDGLRKLDNEPRPAVGFDLDLLAVVSFTQLDI
ncbi:MAG TPA: ATP phosphoribosyltransferase regulatory subunit [Gammaproteobacteria bacterium]|nr:ATP phosphoribosyltransferase regulatory subunit [Gammaproteobacteria bacterium]